MDVNLTPILVALIGGLMTILGSVVSAIVLKRMKDKDSAQVIANAVKNSVGVAVEAAQGVITSAKPHVYIPGIPEQLQAPVQYVLDHAGEELDRHGITVEGVAEKVVAQIGLAKIADPTLPTVIPSPPGVTTQSLNQEELARHRGDA